MNKAILSVIDLCCIYNAEEEPTGNKGMVTRRQEGRSLICDKSGRNKPVAEWRRNVK